MKLTLLTILIVTLCGCQIHKTIHDFSLEEKLFTANKIEKALESDRPKTISNLAGFSGLKNTIVERAKRQGISDFQISQMGLDQFRTYNQIYELLIDQLAYRISQKSLIKLTNHQTQGDVFLLTYSFQLPNEYYDFIDIELASNGSQLFISDLYIYSQGRKVSELIYQMIIQPDFLVYYQEVNKNLSKALNESKAGNQERASYFFNLVHPEELIEPLVAFQAFETTSYVSPELFNNMLYDMSRFSVKKKEKLYWDIFRHIQLLQKDSLMSSIREFKLFIGDSFVLDSMIDLIPTKNEIN